MNFAHLRAFHAVATESSVSRAAKKLGVSQPTLSQQIKALSERHGTPLFERRGSRLELTPLGSTLLEATTRLMTEFSAVADVLRNAGETEIGGFLRIGSDAPSHAATLLVEFRRRHPMPALSMSVQNAETTLRQLLTNEIDIAIVAEPLVQSGLVFLPIWFDTLRLVCARDHPFGALDTVPVQRLAGEVLILREPGSRTRTLVRRLLEESGVEPAQTIEIGSREASREVIAGGMGVGLFVASECGHDYRLIDRPIAGSPVRLGLTEYAICSQDRQRQPIVQEFMSIAQHYAVTKGGMRKAPTRASRQAREVRAAV